MDSRNLNIVDRVTLSYNLVVALLIIIFRRRIISWRTHVSINLLIVALIRCALSRIGPRSPTSLRIVKDFYPLPLCIALYEQTGRINHGLFPQSLDPVVQRMELRIFRSQPSTQLRQLFPQLWLGEYMHFAYASYYLLIPGMGWLLYQKPAVFQEYMLAVCNTFYVCYLLFILFPVYGPPSFSQETAAEGVLFIPLMRFVSGFDIQGAAIPSSHVAVAAVVLHYGRRFVPRASVVVTPLCISLIVSTVYCGYHYAVDAVAGVLLAPVMIKLSRRIGRLASIRVGS